MPMSDVSRIRSQLLGRILRRARFGVERLDHWLFEAEIANPTARMGRSPAGLNRLRSAARPCFAMTTGRTGTQTLAALLNVSPSIDAWHEPEPRMIAASRLAWDGAGDAAFWREAVIVARSQLIGAAFRRGKVYFEGNNRMTFLAGALAEAYPTSRFLIVARNPEDFITSGLKRGYYLGHPWDHARIRPLGDRSRCRTGSVPGSASVSPD